MQYELCYYHSWIRNLTVFYKAQLKHSKCVYVYIYKVTQSAGIHEIFFNKMIVWYGYVLTFYTILEKKGGQEEWGHSAPKKSMRE